MSKEIVFVYVGEGARGSLLGVPKRDLAWAEFEAMPAHVQRSVQASPLYAPAGVDKAAVYEMAAALQETGEEE